MLFEGASGIERRGERMKGGELLELMACVQRTYINAPRSLSRSWGSAVLPG